MWRRLLSRTLRRMPPLQRSGRRRTCGTGCGGAGSGRTAGRLQRWLPVASEVATLRSPLTRLSERSSHRYEQKRPAKLGGAKFKVTRASGGELQFLAGPERDFLAGLDLDRLSGCRVAPHARSPVFHLQDAEPGDPDALAFFQMPGDQSDQFMQEFLSGAFGHVVLFGQIRREVFKRHCRFDCHGLPPEVLASKNVRHSAYHSEQATALSDSRCFGGYLLGVFQIV